MFIPNVFYVVLSNNRKYADLFMDFTTEYNSII